MKRIASILAAVLVAAFVTAGSAGAQLTTVSGTVVSSSPTEVVVMTDDGAHMTFVVDTQSVLPTATLNAGDHVRLVYTSPTPDSMHLNTLTIVTPAAVTTTTTTTTTPSSDNYSTTSAASSSTSYPATAGEDPLLMLAGALALGTGAGLMGLRAIRRG